MTKAVLRETYKAKRAALSPRERTVFNDMLLISFQRVELPDHAQTLLTYWPLESQFEVNTHLMTDFLAFRIPGLRIAYPVTDFKEISMRVLEVNDETSFNVNRYGIAEPEDGIALDPLELDIVFVPLLAFDTNGYRAGYGKGFYDRFLKNCRPDCISIGFSWFDPVPPIDDVDQFDVPLTIGVTPNAVYEF